MVHPKAGSYGAVAQNARKRQKETSTMNKVTAQKKAAPPPTPQGKRRRAKSKERPQTHEEIRKENEYKLLEQEMRNGGDLMQIDVCKLDKMVAKMQLDEKSEEEESEDPDLKTALGLEPVKKEKKKKSTKVKDAPVTDMKMLLKYKIDPDDYMLQYATADEKPIFFEAYRQKCYPCFFNCPITEPRINVRQCTERLLTYASEVMFRNVPQRPYHLPEMISYRQYYRQTAPFTNICINPLQAMRAWGLLSNISLNKTMDELTLFISYYTKGYYTNFDQCNDELLNLHHKLENIFDGCVRLFTELPHHLPHESDIRRKSNVYYGGKSTRAAIQHHCFATDPDGFYSCFRINEEVSLSTRGAIRYVVPENAAPNWRASIALVSAMDCTFYWHTEGEPIETSNFRFNCSKYGESKCQGILALADYRNKGDIYRLEGNEQDVFLFIMLEDPKNVDKPKSIDPNFFKEINSSQGWPLIKNRHVFLPKCTTSNPLSLYEHSKHKGLNRLYSSEKSELRRLKDAPMNQSGSPQFVTLFDHYHKTNFEICASKPRPNTIARTFDELAPERSHQCIDESTSKLFGKFQVDEERLTETLFTYYEDHLNQHGELFEQVPEGFEFDKPNENQLDFGKPFYYVMTRDVGGEAFIVCCGYFNNTVWVINKH